MAFTQVPAPKPRYIRGGKAVGPKRGGLQRQEQGHWALPDGSWAHAPASAAAQGYTQVHQPGSMPPAHLGPGGGYNPPAGLMPHPQGGLIPQLTALGGGSISNIGHILAMFQHLGHLPQEDQQAAAQPMPIQPGAPTHVGGFRDAVLSGGMDLPALLAALQAHAQGGAGQVQRAPAPLWGQGPM